MKDWFDWLLALALAAALVSLGPWMDGQPSDTEAARDTAADLLAAHADARARQRLERAEADMRHAQR